MQGVSPFGARFFQALQKRRKNMKRKLFGILLAALLALSCMSVFAACGDMLTAENGGNGDDTTIVTPGGPDDDPDTPGDPDEEPVTPPK